MTDGANTFIPILAPGPDDDLDAALARPQPMFWVRGNPPGELGDFMKELGHVPGSGPITLEDALAIAQEIRLNPGNDADSVDVFLLEADGHTMSFVARVTAADETDLALAAFQEFIERERGE